jgi:hypothetical protein
MIEAILGALAVAAAEPQKAEPKNDPARWVRASDLPRISDDAAVTTFDLTIDETGKAVGCAIIVSSGSDDLDASVCRAVTKRARFEPASNENGSKVHSARRDRVVWRPQAVGYNKSIDAADLIVTSPEVQTSEELLVEVLLVMTDTGDTSECIVAKASGDAELDELACDAATDPQVALPIVDGTGQKVAGLRSLFVAFEPGPTMSVRIL